MNKGVDYRAMATSILQQLHGLEQDFVKHVCAVVRKEEAPGEAVSGLWHSCRRFARHLFRPTPNARKWAIHYVKEGVEHYNAKNYEKAEEAFKSAIEHDRGYARAHTYLGNTYYKTDHMAKALGAWNQAIKVEPKSDAADKARAKVKNIGPRGLDDELY